MPLVPMRAILEATEKYNYAQGAFNVNAVAQAKAVVEVHEMFRSAAIIQGADLANAFMGGRTDFANGTLGSTYFTGVYYNGTRLSGTQALFTLDSTDAVYNIAADTAAELIATEVVNLSGSRVASSTKNLAPGHYIIRETLSDGTVKSHQTIVTK